MRLAGWQAGDDFPVISCNKSSNYAHQTASWALAHVRLETAVPIITFIIIGASDDGSDDDADGGGDGDLGDGDCGADDNDGGGAGGDGDLGDGDSGACDNDGGRR